jgi:hypothetical protein
MPIKIKYVGFSWDPGFAKGEVLAKFLAEGDEMTTNINETNVLIIGSTITYEECEITKDYEGLRILFLSEPISKLSACQITNKMFENNMYSGVFGCISNNCEKSWVKYPIYKYAFSHNENSFIEVNEYVKNCDINEKRVCFMANRHDWGNTRAPIYNLISQFAFIDCPGKLLNNCSNEEINTIGNVEYAKKYLFNICSENFISSYQPGYITEKLMNACMGGAIPIYFGELDKVDEKIFNRNRILFLNNENTHEIAEKVKKLIINGSNCEASVQQIVGSNCEASVQQIVGSNCEASVQQIVGSNCEASIQQIVGSELEQFYRQPVFMETAYESILKMDKTMMNMFDLIRKIVC